MDVDMSRRTLVGAAGALALGSVAALALAAQPKARVIKVVAKKFREARTHARQERHLHVPV